jgi:hypothetical protein
MQDKVTMLFSFSSSQGPDNRDNKCELQEDLRYHFIESGLLIGILPPGDSLPFPAY